MAAWNDEKLSTCRHLIWAETRNWQRCMHATRVHNARYIRYAKFTESTSTLHNQRNIFSFLNADRHQTVESTQFSFHQRQLLKHSVCLRQSVILWKWWQAFSFPALTGTGASRAEMFHRCPRLVAPKSPTGLGSSDAEHSLEDELLLHSALHRIWRHHKPRLCKVLTGQCTVLFVPLLRKERPRFPTKWMALNGVFPRERGGWHVWSHYHDMLKGCFITSLYITMWLNCGKIT